MLDDALKQSFAPLENFKYQQNIAYLHTDLAQMPKRKKAWSSWNYLRDMNHKETHVAVTYWMNQLQNLKSDQEYLVTLNPISTPDPAKTIKKIVYEHPVFDQAAMDSQEMIRQRQGHHGVWFCGSYLGYGFHEDGLQSSVELARLWNLALPWDAQEEGSEDQMILAFNRPVDSRQDSAPLEQAG